LLKSCSRRHYGGPSDPCSCRAWPSFVRRSRTNYCGSASRCFDTPWSWRRKGVRLLSFGVLAKMCLVALVMTLLWVGKAQAQGTNTAFLGRFTVSQQIRGGKSVLRPVTTP
jgi:hypothetical protein